MFFLSGVARYLFVPLAEAVVFAMLASYVLSRTLVPTLAKYLLQAPVIMGPSRNPLRRIPAGVRARVSIACVTATRRFSPPGAQPVGFCAAVPADVLSAFVL